MRVIITCLLLLLAGCIEDGSEDWAEDLPPSKWLTLTIDGKTEFDTITPAPFVIECITGCMAPYLIIGKYEQDIIRLNFHFSPHFPHNGSALTLADFHEHFERFYLNFWYPEIVEKDAEGDILWTENISFQHSTPLTELGERMVVSDTNGLRVALTSYKDGILKGKVDGVITILAHQYNLWVGDEFSPLDYECIGGDIIGMCTEEENVYLPFTIEFTLPVELPDAVVVDALD